MFLFKLTDLKRVRSSGYDFGRSTTTDSSQNRFGGKILKISPDGKLLHVFKAAAGDGTTNVAFGEREKELYVNSSTWLAGSENLVAFRNREEMLT